MSAFTSDPIRHGRWNIIETKTWNELILPYYSTRTTKVEIASCTPIGRLG